MAIFHWHCDIKSKSTVMAASAYRAGVKFPNEHENDLLNAAAYRSGDKVGKYDYTNKRGVVHSEIMLPDHAPRAYMDRATLWYSAQKTERQHNGQVARDIDLALPIEFSREEQIEALRKHIKEDFVDNGMCADFNIHDTGNGNPHAHIMLTMRPINPDGSWGAKCEKRYVLDRNGNKIKLPSGEWKSHRVNTTDWDKKQTLLKWRENWSKICNERLQAKGLNERIDHRTLKAQGIDREPTIHVGVTAMALERKGIITERGQRNREIIARNKANSSEKAAQCIQKFREGYIMLDREISALSREKYEAEKEARKLKQREEQISERAEYIKGLNKKLDELRTQRQSMGLFQSKKTIAGDIAQTERTIEQAENYFEQRFRITPNRAEAELKRLEDRGRSLGNLQVKLQDKIAPLVEEKNAFALGYHQQTLLADSRPDRQKIHDRIAELENLTRAKIPSPQVIYARNEAERKLNNMFQQNFESIVQGLHLEQRQALTRQRERERGQERVITKGLSM